MGHSWGSVLGTFTVQRYPELFYSYIGVGQASNTIETEKIMYQFTLDKATEFNNRKAIKKLTELELIKIKRKGIPAKNYYKICYNKILKILTSGDKNNQYLINY